MKRTHQRTDWIPDTSPSLLLRIRDTSDTDSWLLFQRTYGAVVRRYCQSWNLQKADIDDIVQDVMKTVSDAISSFEYDPSKGQFRGWLGTVTGNKIRRFLGREARHRHASLHEGFDNMALPADPDDGWVAVYAEVILKEACSITRTSFEESTWQCFELTWLKQIPHDVAAERLGLQISSVYVNKSRVLKRLEKVIRDLTEALPIERQ